MAERRGRMGETIGKFRLGDSLDYGGVAVAASFVILLLLHT